MEELDEAVEQDRREYDWEKQQGSELTLASEAIEASLQGSKLLFGGARYEPPVAQGDETVYRRGLARNVMLALDLGESVTLSDPAPSRLAWMMGAVKGFIREFFDANPLSQLGIVASRDAQAFRVSPLSSNPEQHIRALEELPEPSGSVSVQNTLQLCVVQLRHVPAHATREIVCVWSALTSCDPGDLEAEMHETQRAGVRCSLVHLGAAVYVLQRLARLTGGS
jgi:transcription initiation factor TFIIH subunit 2